MSQNANTMAPAKPLLSDEQKASFIRDGYLHMSGLIADDVVKKTREDLAASLGIVLDDPTTWKTKAETVAWAWGAGPMTVGCRNKAVEQVAEELLGPIFMPQISIHTGKNSVGLDAREEGYIPVLTYATPGETVFIRPQGWHLDGINATAIPPTEFYVVVFTYLTDTPLYGGATTVQPGAHRIVFESLLKTGELPGWDLTPAKPLAGKAGDVIFMHCLLPHSGSDNFSDHVRLGLNTAVMVDPEHPYELRSGTPDESWTPFDITLRTDNLDIANLDIDTLNHAAPVAA